MFTLGWYGDESFQFSNEVELKSRLVLRKFSVLSQESDICIKFFIIFQYVTFLNMFSIYEMSHGE